MDKLRQAPPKFKAPHERRTPPCIFEEPEAHHEWVNETVARLFPEAAITPEIRLRSRIARAESLSVVERTEDDLAILHAAEGLEQFPRQVELMRAVLAMGSR